MKIVCKTNSSYQRHQDGSDLTLTPHWLFCGSDRGGRAAAVHFSLIASCARRNLDPFAYLRDLFTQ